MTNDRGASDSRGPQATLEERIAVFIDGLLVDAVSTSRSNNGQESSASEQNQEAVMEEAPPVEQTSAPMATPVQERQPRRGRQAANRRRRYRDERQKLSNSLAQKRYRDRKKRSFEQMKQLVDELTAEVGRLHVVRRENEKLTLEMEEYRQLAELHGMTRLQQPQPDVNGGNKSSNSVHTPPIAALPLVCPTNPQLSLMEGSGQTLLSVQNLQGTDWASTLSQLCQVQGPMSMDHSLSLDERAERLEKDWNERMTAVEHFLNLYQMCGSPAGSSSEHLVPTMRACMANLFSMNSELASMKLQQVSQDTQANNSRVQKAFLFLSNDSQ